jgi:hypothetical protein
VYLKGCPLVCPLGPEASTVMPAEERVGLAGRVCQRAHGVEAFMVMDKLTLTAKPGVIREVEAPHVFADSTN